MLTRPKPTEHAPYYSLYIDKVREGDILEVLAQQNRQTLSLLESIGEEKARFRYAPDKWSLKLVIGHVIDVERVFAYRALAFARNDPAKLPSMEQEDYAANANYDRRPLPRILAEFAAVRAATLALFESFDAEIGMRRGTASGYEFTARSMPYIIAGHELHHVGVLRERYL